KTSNDFPELKQGSFNHELSEEHFTVYSRENKPYLKRHQIGFDGAVTNLFESQIDYWIGSGNHARSYFSRTKNEELIELPITWYAEKNGYWAMSPAYDRADHAGFSRKINLRCLSCHVGNIQMQLRGSFESGTRLPEKLPQGIDCQRCHGPGQAHVEAVQQSLPVERIRGAIINPARLSTERQLELCMQCHLETTSLKLPASISRFGRGIFSYLPGEPLEKYILHFDRAAENANDEHFEFVSAAYRMRESQCFKKSGTMTCTTCHNPHEPSNTQTSFSRYTKACQSCHQATVQKLVSENSHPNSENCASCHMPKRRPSDAIHTFVTDHLIQKRPVVDSSKPLVERHDGNTPLYRGKVELYYPAKIEKSAENELYLALAQVRHDANLEQGTKQLEEAIKRAAPERAEFYFELAEAYRRAGNLEKAVVVYEQACMREPQSWQHFYRLGATLTTIGKSERAAQVLSKALSLAPNESAIFEVISNLLARQGKFQESVATLREALKLDPENAGLHSLLGARLLQLNDTKAAEQAWREAVRLRPEQASAQLNLANLLSSTGRFKEAQHHFKAALRIAPSFADAHLAYANALAANGYQKEAEQHYREANKLRSK
ncbi:MAG TPA: tetratricopeptide repeat protein, partial [Blastocatellia bacterium]|nr:tetratricopeptide repeat protein [Blastocatellia bacterium]